MDGDGVAAEFELYDATACSGLDTYVYAYNPSTDRIVHYPFRVTESDGKVQTSAAGDRFLYHRPVEPGHWQYAEHYNSGHTCHFDLRLNKAQARFEGTMTCKPWDETPKPRERRPIP